MGSWSGFRRGEAGIAAILLLLGLYVAWSGTAMDPGTFAIPGPGVFPIAIGGLLTVVALGILLGPGVAGDGQAAVTVPGREAVVTVLALGAAAFAFERVGAAVTFAVFLAILHRTYSRRPWWQAILFGAAGAAIAWVVFARVLLVSLPWSPW
jgi:uncharacterized BrkB/YihY/UPF0761 family membrane protein